MMRPSLEINWIVIQKFDSVLNSYGYTQKNFIVCEILVYYIIHNNVLAISFVQIGTPKVGLFQTILTLHKLSGKV